MPQAVLEQCVIDAAALIMHKNLTFLSCVRNASKKATLDISKNGHTYVLHIPSTYIQYTCTYVPTYTSIHTSKTLYLQTLK